MTRRILVIRPEPANAVTCARARALGLDAVGLALFEIEPRNWSAPAVAGFEALLITSANAVRMGGAELTRLASLPVWAVGTRTAAAAHAAGLTVEHSGTAGLDALLAGKAPRPMLHLCGADRLIGEQAAQWPITPLIAYENVALFPNGALSALLHAHPVTLLHSARAARHFAGLVAAGGHDRASLSIAAISPAVAEAAGQGWQRVAIAPQTGDEALLRSAAQLMGA